VIEPGMEGLRTDQAPPLTIPASFFLLAPLSMMAAGALLAAHGQDLLASRWLPAAMAATHLGTLGFLGAIMLGALYQMIPVVAGAPREQARPRSSSPRPRSSAARFSRSSRPSRSRSCAHPRAARR